jgi:hypothetical protein
MSRVWKRFEFRWRLAASLLAGAWAARRSDRNLDKEDPSGRAKRPGQEMVLGRPNTMDNRMIKKHQMEEIQA